MTRSSYDKTTSVNTPNGWTRSVLREPVNVEKPNQNAHVYDRLHRTVRRADLGLAQVAEDRAWLGREGSETGGSGGGGDPASSANPDARTGCLPWSGHVSSDGVSVPLGRPLATLTPTPSEASGERVKGAMSRASATGATPTPTPGLPRFSDLTSVRAMRRDEHTVVVGYDTEYQGQGAGQQMASYQASWLSNDGDDVHHLALLPVEPTSRLRLRTLLAEIIEHGRLWASPLAPEGFGPTGVRVDSARVWLAHKENGEIKRCKTLKGAVRASDYPEQREALEASVTRSGGRTRYVRATGTPSEQRKGVGVGYEIDLDVLRDQALPVTLVAHYGKADVWTFGADPELDLLVHLMEAGGGVMSRGSVFFTVPVPGQKHPKVWPVRLTWRDSRAHAPAGKGSVSAIGDTLGLPKLVLPGGAISRMVEFREEDLGVFLDYALRDCDVAREYVSRIYGDNREIPMTLSSAAASAARSSLKTFYGVEKEEEFRMVYTGMKRLEMGLREIEKDNRGPSFAVESRWEPMSRDAMQLTLDFQNAYKGGLNACMEVGVVTGVTYDFDLCSAYPTAMAVVPDLDWEHPSGVLTTTWRNEELTPDMVPSPTTPFAGYVSFEFDESVAHPCIPVTVGGSLVFPRSTWDSEGKEHPVYVAGPEVWLALQLGARVFCHGGSVGRLRYVNEGERGPRKASYSLRAAVKQMVDDRGVAKKVYGPKSTEELTLKTGANSFYGKTAQDLIASNSWNAYLQKAEEIGGSAITSAYHAAMITSIVRATLSAAMNELDVMGYRSFSVTTDGFITDAPEEVVTGLHLYGLRDVLRVGRRELAGTDQVWEIKHGQTWLLNFNTRGNVGRVDESLGLAPVCAHAGLRTGFEKDGHEDREALIEAVVTRTSKPVSTGMVATSFRAMTTGTPDKRKGFELVESSTRLGTIDYDLKRKPVEETMTVDLVELDGVAYEVCHFETVPWSNLDEYHRAREVRAGMSALRTPSDWKTFALRMRHSKKGERNIADAGRAIAMAILVGHRLGAWEVPFLSSTKTVAAKIAWINSWKITDAEHYLKPGDWKNARRPERAGQLLPREELEPWLSAMIEFEGDGLPSWEQVLELNGGRFTEKTSGMKPGRRAG